MIDNWWKLKKKYLESDLNTCWAYASFSTSSPPTFTHTNYSTFLICLMISPHPLIYSLCIRRSQEWHEIMKKVVTSVSSNNHEPSGRFHAVFHVTRSVRQIASATLAQMDTRNTWHYDGNSPWLERRELKVNRYPQQPSPSIKFHHF